MRMTNVPASYELAKVSTAANFVNQAKAWLIQEAKVAAAKAAEAADAAADAERQARSAQRAEEAFKASPSICRETVQAVADAAATLTAEAAKLKAAAAEAAEVAAELKKAVLTACTLPAINTWEEI